MCTYDRVIELDKELQNLIQLYRRRVDLQDTYPEVKDGNYQALINWAAGVSSKRWIDADSEFLVKFKQWYVSHEAPIVRPKNEDLILEAIEKSNVKAKYTMENVIKESDISEHLTTLFLITTEFKLKRILELGVREGLSTMTLVEAASQIDGHVWSIDIDSCSGAKEKISKVNLDKYWTFMQGNDIEIGKNWNQEVDHIFIDTSHIYQHTLDEMNTYDKFLTRNGFMTFHDTRSFPGVLRAIKDFLAQHPNQYNFYNYLNNNGFAILRKIC